MPNARIAVPQRVATRAASSYITRGDHWISTYSVASHGYAQIGWKDETGTMRGTTAHRAAWVFHYGDPGSDTIDHRNFCGERRCVRPEHLRRLSNLENARRTEGRDWTLGECINGHSHEQYWKPKGEHRLKGYCKACRHEMRERKKINH